MNKFEHKDGLQIKRINAFELAQQEAFKNLSQRVMPMLSSYGVVMDIIGDGLSNQASLKVEEVSFNNRILKIRSGYAIIEGASPSDHDFIVVEEDTEITISDKLGVSHTGTAYVIIEPNQISVASGYEIYKPGMLGSTNRIFLLSEESATITMVTGDAYVPDASKIVLAKVHLTGSKLSYYYKTYTLNEPSSRPYIDSDDTEMDITESTLGLNVPTSGWELLIGKEQVGYSGLSGNTITLTSASSLRTPLNDTVGNLHRNGVTITNSAIIDLRQTNKAGMETGNSSVIQKLINGIINYGDGNGDRFIKTMRVPDVPNTPSVSGLNVALVWLNKQTTGGNVSEDATKKIRAMKGEKTRLDNLSSTLADLKLQLPSASADNSIIINNKIADTRLKMSYSRASLVEKSNGLSTYSKAFSATKKYIAAFVINQPILIDGEQVVKYEAEVTYLPADGSSIDKISGVTAQVFSKTLLPNSINNYGDYVYTYDIQPDIGYRYLQIPIRYNEKIEFRIRAVTEYNMASDWSEVVSYVFNQLSSADTQLSIDLDDISTGIDPYQNGIITQETVELLMQLRNDFIIGLGQLQGYMTDVDDLKAEINELKAEINELRELYNQSLLELNTVITQLDVGTGSSA